jgi:hypothetical protein
MVMNRRWLAASLAAGSLGFAGLLVACSSGASPAAQPKVPSFTTPAATSSSAAAPTVPKECTLFAVAAEVDGIVGHQLPGAMIQVVGIPEASIGRTGRLDCYYGVVPGQPLATAAVTIGLASYTDAAIAQHRAALTVNGARNSGAATSDVTVGTTHAVYIAGQQNQELVLTKGNETILITAANGVLAQGKVGDQLVALAQRALSPQ